VPEFSPHTTPARYLTADVPGTGGVLKQRPEDFIVEELPAYEPCGEGEHLYLFVQKVNMATMHVVRLLADHFGVRRDAVGVAGLKDKAAVTTQLFSVHAPGRRPEDFPAFEHRDATVLWVDRHTNKLRRGHLKGNRFIIRIRGAPAGRVVHAQRSLALLQRLGAPNRIGTQRFGILGNNHRVGRALLLGDHRGALDELLGPSAERPEIQPEARRLYAEGKYPEAMAALTGGSHTERRVLAALARGAKPRDALRAIEPLEHGFYITALQSAVFNAVLDARIEDGTLGALVEGDLAFKHDSGAVFPVTAETLADAGASLANRALRMELSPSGPMWGPEMPRASGPVDAAEVAALAGAGLTPDGLAGLDRRAVKSMVGQRRPLRVPLTYPDIEAGVDERGDYIKCVFELPRGAFATSVMQEIMKTAVAEEGGE
jgi:tRNA pseudouridine13 synthase